MIPINKDFKTLRKGSKFVQSYIFGHKVTPPVPYVVSECHKKDGYVIAYDLMGDLYKFYPMEFRDYQR